MKSYLLDDHVDVDVDAEDVLEDDVEVRKVMIVITQLEREADVVHDRTARIVEDYKTEEKSLRERADFLREKVRAYVAVHGKIRFPDVGTAYETKTQPKLVISDREAVVEKYGDTFTKSDFDETEFKRWALERFETSGEIPDGCDVVRESTTLAIRKS